MTDEQINRAIAEACGWTDVHFSLAATDEFPTQRRVVGMPPGHYTHNVVPNYCVDLNAMHGAEELLDYEKSEAFSNAVADIVHAANHEKDYPFPWCFARIHATARQRAEAFLRTLGKWEEAK